MNPRGRSAPADGGHVKRCYVVTSAFLLGAAILAAHLFFLQFNAETSAYYRSSVADHWQSSVTLSARRGNILYRDGSLLATNRKLARVVIEPEMFAGDGVLEASEKLAGYVDIPADEIRHRVAEFGRRGMVLKEGIPVHEALALDREGLRGVFTRYYYERYYPQGEYGAAMTVGYVGAEPGLRSGAENTLDTTLTGVDGCLQYGRDNRHQRLPDSVYASHEKQDGIDATLTLDPAIQFICEDELREALQVNQAEWALILVMDPNNGEVLGLSTHPTCDPNEYARGNIDGPEYNVLVHRLYEPGSTVKPILSAYALDRGWLDPTRRFKCNEYLPIGKYTIREAMNGQVFGGNDGLTIAEIINKSSNIGMARVALSLGQDRVLESFEHMGFFDRTGIELPGEYRGYRPYNYAQSQSETKLEWPRITLANTGFGQGLSVTPMQIARAYCIIANGGYWVEPTLLFNKASPIGKQSSPTPTLPPGWELVTDFEQSGIQLGRSLSTPALAQDGDNSRVRVLSPDTVSTIQTWLKGVVNNGTGTNAALVNQQAAGKTGTAQVYSETGGYAKGQYTASFCGFFPADSPRYVVFTLFCKPKGKYYGSEVAAPVFKAVGDRIIYLDRLSMLEAGDAS